MASKNSPAHRAIETRRARGEDFSKTARESWDKKITPSEENYVKRLRMEYGLEESDIVHGAGGYPDIMCVTKDGELHFYEIKPSKGESRLNPLQRKTIRLLLKSKNVRVFLVRYSGSGRNIQYEKRVPMTPENLEEY